MRYRSLHIVFILAFFGLGMQLCAQYTISGYVIDSENRETLIGATILLKDANKGVVTDNNGFFRFPGFKKGTYLLEITHVGFEKKEIKVIIENRSVLIDDVELNPKSLTVEEVSIVAVKPDEIGDRDLETSRHELSAKMIQSIPTARNDVFAAVKYLPGIDRTEPFSPLFTTRGGDPGENAVLLDGITIYNPYHAAITSGIFNALTIKNVDMMTGGFGAEYGGRNSAVMYITTKDGNYNELHGEIEPSTLHSKLFLEFPTGKDAAMIIAGRYYYDIPINFILNSHTYFYDLNLSYTKRINQRNRISVKLFESKDKTGLNFNTFYKYIDNSFNTDIYDDFELNQSNNWNNRAVTIIHKSILTPNIYLRNQVYYSFHQSNNYSGLDFNLDYEDEETHDTITLSWRSNSRFKSKIADLSAKSGLSFRLAHFNSLNVGVEYNSYLFENGTIINDADKGSAKRTPDLLAFFAEDKLTIGPLVLRPGMRFTNYNKQGWKYEPRFNMLLNLPWNTKLKLAWGEYLQYIISMNTNEVELSQIVDYYHPLTLREPSKSIHYIFGVEKAVTKSLLVNLDLYYKNIARIYTFDVNLDSIEAFMFTDKMQEGSGRAYGAELIVQGSIGKFSGWAAYSLAWAYRTYPHLNEGQEFPFDYNRRHTFKTVINYQITKNFSYSTSLVYQSGYYRSIEGMTQSFYNYDPVNNSIGYFPLWISTGKNNAKMPDLINLDMGIKKKIVSGFGKKLTDLFKANESYLSVTIKNILFFRRNVEWYFPGFDRYYDKYFPLGSNYLPAVGISYTIKF